MVGIYSAVVNINDFNTVLMLLYFYIKFIFLYSSDVFLQIEHSFQNQRESMQNHH